MNKKYDNNNIIIASRAYFLQKEVTIRWRNLSAWSSDWPKEWLFSVQSSSTESKSDSSVSKVVQQLPCWIEALHDEQGYPQATHEEGSCPGCE
jgi:hypothetical protein